MTLTDIDIFKPKNSGRDRFTDCIPTYFFKPRCTLSKPLCGEILVKDLIEPSFFSVSSFCSEISKTLLFSIKVNIINGTICIHKKYIHFRMEIDESPRDVGNQPGVGLPWVEKYRPKELSDLISHEEIIQTIQKFIDQQQLPHLLFYGPPGTGKTSTILAVAQQLYG